MLELINVCKTFNPGTVNAKTALNDLNLTLKDGDFITVIGGNGAGKSTMLNAIAGSFQIDSGKIVIDGTDVTVSAEVENIGETWPAGEAVQVYISRPDAAGTQPVWLLDCFARTKLLAPGERETVQLRFPVTELAAYRESACAFALEEGYYDVRVGFHSRGTYIAGSLRSMQRAMVQAVTPLRLDAPESGRVRDRKAAFTYPGEAEELTAALKRAIKPGDVILFKGSHGMHLEKVLEEFLKEET